MRARTESNRARAGATLRLRVLPCPRCGSGLGTGDVICSACGLITAAEIERAALEREPGGAVPSLGGRAERSRSLGLAGRGPGSLAGLGARLMSGVIEFVLMLPMALTAAIVLAPQVAEPAQVAGLIALTLFLVGVVVEVVSVRACGSGLGGIVTRIGVFDQGRVAEMIETSPASLPSRVGRSDERLRPGIGPSLARAGVHWGMMGLASCAWVSPLLALPLVLSALVAGVRRDGAGLAELASRSVWLQVAPPRR